MDINEQIQWERERAEIMTQNVSQFANSISSADDKELIEKLRQCGETSISSHMEYLIREASNVAHRTYHIAEDMEDAGEEQAVRRSNYLAFQASRINVRLGEARKKAKTIITHKQMVIEKSYLAEAFFSITAPLIDRVKRQPELLSQLSPQQFEELIMELLFEGGWNVKASGNTFAKDGGIDFVAIPKNQKLFPIVLAGQVKSHRGNKKTGVSAVDRLLAWKGSPFHLGLLFTNTSFTQNALWKAKQESNRNFIRLRDSHDIRNWLKKGFSLEQDYREIPDKINVAPGVTVEVPKWAFGNSMQIWPLSLEKEKDGNM